MAQIVTVKNSKTNEIQYPKTVKSALLNDDGTPLDPLTQTNIINNLTTGGATKVLSAEQGKVLNSAIEQLQTDIGNIDVNGGDADTLDGKHASDFLASIKGNGVLANDLGVATELRWKNYGQGHTIFDGSAGLSPNGVTVPKDNAQQQWNASYPILMGWNGANTYGVKVDTSRTSDLVKGRDLCTEVDGLKSSVVNGKQAVVNAINGSLGYASGLTTSHTHDDYAWWIQNKVLTSSEKLKKLYNQITSCTTVLSMSYTALPYTSISGSSWYRTLEPGLYFMQDMSWRSSSGYPIKLIAPTVTVYIDESNSTTITDLPVICKGLTDKVTHTYRLILITETTQLRGYDPNSTRIYDAEKVWYKLNI